MNTHGWLEVHAPGFNQLSEEERTAVLHFTFLWSLFEAEALNEKGSVPALLAAATEWSDKNLMPKDAFDPELGYFRDRCYAHGAPTPHFAHLHFRNTDRQDLVEDVFGSKLTDRGSIAGALLIVVYRLRNNFMAPSGLTTFKTSSIIFSTRMQC